MGNTIRDALLSSLTAATKKYTKVKRAAVLVSRLAELETVIERGLTTFVEVGQALMEIRDTRLYRDTHPTFEAYVKARWGFTKQWAYQQIESAEVLAEVKMSLPSVEHAHLLAPFPAEEQRTLAPLIATATVREAREIIREHRGGGNGTGLPHIAQATGESEWYTPKEIIEAARLAMGGIDCDPATHTVAQAVVQARQYFTKETDGLSHEWHGSVYLNPAYSHPLVGRFCEKLLAELHSGRTTQAITLTNNATETTWGQSLLSRCLAVCFLTGRVKFWNPEKESFPLQGQMLCYFGRTSKAFYEHFTDFGVLLRTGA